MQVAGSWMRSLFSLGSAHFAMTALCSMESFEAGRIVEPSARKSMVES